MDQLAGGPGTFGAVGVPDLDSFSLTSAHCDNADYLAVDNYPQSRGEATGVLLRCVQQLSFNFFNGIDGATDLFGSDGELVEEEVDLEDDCVFVLGIPGRAKCDALEGFGRALHGIQDFYSHSNWTDDLAEGEITVNNPPGMDLPAPSPLLNLGSAALLSQEAFASLVPLDLTTGFFGGITDDLTVVCSGLLSVRNERVTHACINKDKALIDPATGNASDPSSFRGRQGNNQQKAVDGAIAETSKQWADFRAALRAKYGAVLGDQMAVALTQDEPGEESDRPVVQFLLDISGSMAGQKLVDAKDAMTVGIDALLEDQLAGLRSFGGGCGSLGTLQASPESGNRDQLRAAVDALRAGGSTPTPSALEGAAADLTPFDGPLLLILISDGQSTCGDPCPTAERIKAELGIDFQTVAIGFQASVDAASELQCIAEATGGSYLEADDAAGLREAIRRTIEPVDGNLETKCATLEPTILGTDGDDTLRGTTGDDVIFALGGDDRVYGDSGDDIICLGAGNDRAWGEAGNDEIAGGPGDDQLYGAGGADLILGGDDSDALWGGDDDDQISGGGGNDQVHGGSGNDIITGEVGLDSIWGNDGDDTISGGDSRDRIFGGSGDDDLGGGNDDDVIHGEGGSDRLIGGDGADLLYGSSGKDVLDGETGADYLNGGPNADQCLNGDRNLSCET